MYHEFLMPYVKLMSIVNKHLNLKLRASVSDTAGPLLGSFHMVRSAFSTTLWQCAFTRHFRFFQIVLPPVNTTSMLPTHDGS
jgi:hypothetical protein